MGTYTVVGIIETKLNHIERMKIALSKVMECSLKEPGCLNYRVHQDSNNPGQFILYENWESQKTHEAQFEKPYILEFIDKTKAMLEKPFKVHMTEEILV